MKRNNEQNEQTRFTFPENKWVPLVEIKMAENFTIVNLYRIHYLFKIKIKEMRLFSRKNRICGL